MKNQKDGRKVATIVALSVFVLLVILGTIYFIAIVFGVMKDNIKPNTPKVEVNTTTSDIEDIYVPSETIEERATNKDVNHLVDETGAMDIAWDESTFCTSKPSITDIGRPQYPINPKYRDVNFLGQVFTAYECGTDRVNEIFGVTDGRYTLGSNIWLSNKPSKELMDIFEQIGYKCVDKIEIERCLEWELLDTVNVDELMKLEPYYENIKQDDCRYCG
jgi:hypothetical protein